MLPVEYVIFETCEQLSPINISVTSSSTVYVHWSTVTLGLIISGPGIIVAVIGILLKLSHSPELNGVVQYVVVVLMSGVYIVPVWTRVPPVSLSYQ